MSTTFVGRQQELDELVGLYRSAAAGSSRLALVGGDAGIGKSTLVAELGAVAANDGGRVLLGACMNFGGAPPPYLPLIEALRGAADLPALSEVRAEASRARLFEDVLRTFVGLAEATPVVLALEDLHWADPSTLDLLGFLARNLGDARILIVGTYRTDDLPRNHPLRPVLAELRRHPRATHLTVPPFELDEVRVQLTELLAAVPQEALVRRVLERSDGVPFFVGELASCCLEDQGLPSSVQQVMNTRLDALGEGARALVEAAAVIGTTVEHTVLDRVSPVEPAALREAIGAAVLVVDDDGRSYRFRHSLLREVVVAEMLPGDRVRLHAAVAESLPSTAAAERAFHWRQANRLPEALAASIEAACEAERVFAFPEAVEHHSTALELWASVRPEERPAGERLVDLLVAAAESAALAGQVTRAVALEREALAEARSDEAGTRWVALARYLRAAGRLDESIEASESALAVLPPGPSVERARALAGLAGVQGLRYGFGRPRVLAGEAVAMAVEVGDAQAEGTAQNALGLCLGATGDFEGGVVALQRALELAVASGDLDGIGRAYVNLGDIFFRAGELEAALRVTEEGIAELDRRGIHLRGAMFLDVNAAEFEIELGRWNQARVRLDRVDAGEQALLTELHRGLTRCRLATRQGDLLLARRELDAIEPKLREVRDAQFPSGSCLEQAELAIWEGRPLDALDAAQVGLETAVAALDGRKAAELQHLAWWATADAVERRLPVTPPAADPELDALLVVAGQGAVPYIHLADANRARVAGADEPARWAAAADVAGTVPFVRALARWREGAALLDRRDGGAEGPLREAARLAADLGAAALLREVVALARRARVDLEVAGDVAHDAPVSPLAGFGLTAREEEVLALLADGLSNREIGERLFINTKTASVHVSNILAKLGVSSRVQAATLAARVR